MKNNKTRILSALLCVLLVGCMLFLCACPGGGGGDTTCTHSFGDDGVCTLCGEIKPCEHTYGTDGICTKCGNSCAHSFKDGVCSKCGAPQPDDNIVYGEGAVIENAGDSIAADAAVLTPVTYKAEPDVEQAGAILFRSFKGDGKTWRATGDKPATLSKIENKTYGGNSTVLILDAGMKVDGGSGITFRDMIIVGDVQIVGASSVTFENVQIFGNVTVEKDCSDVVFLSCRLDGATALTNKGAKLGVKGCFVKFTEAGILDSGNGTIVLDNRFEGNGTAIKSAATSASYTYNTVTVNAEGIGVAMEKGTTNCVAGMNVIRGAQTSALIKEVYNTSFVRNTVISIKAEKNHALYVIDNAMGGRLTATDNNYLLADGNTFADDGKTHVAVQSGNQNVNGDTLMDVNYRPEVGADEAQLPHVDKDLFVGMEAQSTVRLLREDAVVLYSYIAAEAAKKDVVIITPGKYEITTALTLNERHNDTTVYAHGVYAEAQLPAQGVYKNGHVRISNAKNIAIKGLTMAYDQQTCGQVYVLEKIQDVGGAGEIRVVTGAGMWNDFGDSGSQYMSATGIGIQRAGTFYAIGDFAIKDKTIRKQSNGTMTLRVPSDVYEILAEGDIMTCRLESGATSVQVSTSSDVLLMDMTLYGYSSGFAFYETKNVGATTYYRVYNTTRYGEIIDKATYDRYEAYEAEYGVDLEVWVDDEGRYRGSYPHIGSIDATHTSYCAVGSQVISCVFENMCDDGTNQNSGHARLSEIIDNGDGTSTIIYKGNLSATSYNQSTNRSSLTFSRYCAEFRVGDRVFIYTSGGQIVCDSTAITATKGYDVITVNHPDKDLKGKTTQRYSVTVNTADINPDALNGFDLTDDNHKPDHKVLVDNMSRASNGFLFDNMVVRNNRSRGLLIKASDGAITNCTFENNAKVAIAIIYEIQWGESGISENVRVERNLINHTSYSPGGGIINEIGYVHCPIAIIGMGGRSTDPDFLPYKNISIVGNKFINRVISNQTYAIYVQAAQNVLIKDNDFGYSEEDTAGRFATAIFLRGAMNIELSNNIYPPMIDGDVLRYIDADSTSYKNVHGTDVEDVNGNSVIADQK